MWQLGEVERARELIEQANRRASELGHAPSKAHPLWRSHLEILRGDPAAVLITAEALEGLGQEYGLPFWRTAAALRAGWARGRHALARREKLDKRSTDHALASAPLSGRPRGPIAARADSREVSPT
jgi:hypothetical protein